MGPGARAISIPLVDKATPAPRAPETAEAVTERLTLEDNRVALALCGERNANLKLIERETGAQLHTRGNELTIVGPDDGVAIARSLVEQLYALERGGAPIRPEHHRRSAVAPRQGEAVHL